MKIKNGKHAMEFKVILYVDYQQEEIGNNVPETLTWEDFSVENCPSLSLFSCLDGNMVELLDNPDLCQKIESQLLQSLKNNRGC
jgi:hypothetical protein